MSHSDHYESQEGADSRFGRVFSAYSKAFRSRDDDGLKAAFHPEAIVLNVASPTFTHRVLTSSRPRLFITCPLCPNQPIGIG